MVQLEPHCALGKGRFMQLALYFGNDATRAGPRFSINQGGMAVVPDEGLNFWDVRGTVKTSSCDGAQTALRRRLVRRATTKARQRKPDWKNLTQRHERRLHLLSPTHYLTTDSQRLAAMGNGAKYGRAAESMRAGC